MILLSFIKFNNLPIVSFEAYIYKTKLSIENDFFLSFSYLTMMVKIPRAVLIQSYSSGHPCLTPDF